MPKSLVIVESPAKAKTINKFLGPDFQVTASMGHIRDLPPKALGVDVDNNFQPTYETSPDKEKTIRELHKLAKKSETIYLAPDPDREGEAISWHLAEILGPKLNGQTIRRVTFNEITKQAIQNAILHPGEIDMDRVNAQQARRILDRLVGYKISPLLTRLVTRNKSALSAGRVQSVALRLICEREEEIRAFVPVEYWTILGKFKNADGVEIQAELYSVGGDKINHQGEGKEKEDKETFHIQNEQQAQELIEALHKAVYSIGQIDSRKRTRRPPAPYITSTLQQDASRLLGFTGDRTMRAAQALYEGVDIGSETVGLITYMRTDSVRIAGEAVAKCREYVSHKYGQEYVPDKPNFFKSSKSAQEAHEAIRPTILDDSHTPHKVSKHLKSDQAKLYDLIWKRFLACQMASAEYLATTITIVDDRFVFRATGSVLTFDGFMRIYRDPDDDTDQLLPPMKEGEKLDMMELDSDQHFTRPPARYNDASLIKELESEGIGRPSTYASIVKTLVDRRYIERKEKRFYPSDLGEIVNKLLVKNFPDIFEVGFTAGVEAKLDEVEEGKADWVSLLKNFYEPFEKDLSNAPKGMGEVLRNLQQPIEDKICPKCQNKLVKKWGRTSWFIACTNYPDCDYTAPLEETEVIPTDIPCDKCGKIMVIRPGKYGPFLGCSAYPDCKTTKPIPSGLICPKPDCGGNIVQRRSRFGKLFYGCDKYPDCDFAAWDYPIVETCPKCGNLFLVKKDYKRKGPTIKCPQKGCNYSRQDDRPGEGADFIKKFIEKYSNAASRDNGNDAPAESSTPAPAMDE
ncbi:MAG: type I DNA topoisomerase [Candidatus Omnitrophota bacterium]